MKSYWYMRLAWKFRRYVGCTLGLHYLKNEATYCLMGCGYRVRETP